MSSGYAIRPIRSDAAVRTAAIRHAATLAAALLGAALSGCAAQGTPYAEVMAHAPPVGPATTRVIFLRPPDGGPYNGSTAVLRIDGEKIARLAYGGFFYVDRAAGTALVRASGSRGWTGKCELELHGAGGDTVYFRVRGRGAHAAAGLLGSIAVGSAVEAALPPAKLERLLPDAAAVGAAAAAGGAAASAIEGAGRECGGPWRLEPVAAVEARSWLGELVWSR